MTFGTLLWKSVNLTRAALLLRDIAGIGSAPPFIEMAVVSQDVIAPFVPKWVRSARK